MRKISLTGHQQLISAADRFIPRLLHICSTSSGYALPTPLGDPNVPTRRLDGELGMNSDLAQLPQLFTLADEIIVEAAAAQSLALLKIDEAQYEVGYGLKVWIDQQLVRVGSSRFMEKEDITIPQEIYTIQEHCHQLGHSLVMVAMNKTLIGAIELQPTVRPEAKKSVQGLRKRGIQSTYILSGDHEALTRKLVGELRIDHYFAETLPQHKAAQIILLNGGLDALCELFDLAKEYEDNMNRTFWAVVGSCVLCVGGVYFAGFGLVTTILLKQLGLFTGIAGVLSPLRAHRHELTVHRTPDQSKLQIHLAPQNQLADQQEQTESR